MFKKMLMALVLVGSMLGSSAEAADDHSMVLTGAYHEEFIVGFRLYLDDQSGGPVWVAPFTSKTNYIQVATQDGTTAAGVRYMLQPELALRVGYATGDMDAIGGGVDYYLSDTMAVGGRLSIFDFGGADVTVLTATFETLIGSNLWIDLAYSTGDDIDDGLHAEAKFFIDDNLYVGARLADGAAHGVAATDMLLQSGGDAILAGYEHEGKFDVEVAINSDSSGVAFNLRF